MGIWLTKWQVNQYKKSMRIQLPMVRDFGYHLGSGKESDWRITKTMTRDPR